MTPRLRNDHDAGCHIVEAQLGGEERRVEVEDKCYVCFTVTSVHAYGLNKPSDLQRLGHEMMEETAFSLGQQLKPDRAVSEQQR